MITQRIIPCLDVRDGRVVKGVKFQNLRDTGNPADLAARYEAEGADEITLLDVSATTESRRAALDTVERVRNAISIPLTVGGGVGCAHDVYRLLCAGADKVGINTAAFIRPELIRECATQFGSQCIVVAIDAAKQSSGIGWNVVIRSGKEHTALEAAPWARRASELGAGEILLTSWDRDGTHAGYDLELLRGIREVTQVPIVASGGAASPAHMLEAIEAGADAVLAASIFHDSLFTISAVKHFLSAAGLEVRI